ncbi:MAG: hypothetical protein ABFS22_10910 [Pseudomonadota bacterium]
MHYLIRIALLLVLTSPLLAADWNSRLSGGRGDVTIDDNNRATVRQGGVERPLWDGTHKLEDGSTLIIRQGIAVPNPSVLEFRQQLPPPRVEEWEDNLIVGTSPCERLTRKVCGADNTCSDDEACLATWQLLEQERDERHASHNPNLMTPTSGQCLQAHKDREFFVACRTETRQQ